MHADVTVDIIMETDMWQTCGRDFSNLIASNEENPVASAGVVLRKTPHFF